VTPELSREPGNFNSFFSSMGRGLCPCNFAVMTAVETNGSSHDLALMLYPI